MNSKGLLALAMSAAALCALAQAPFTILRPVNGAKVREMVKIEIPRRSIPDNGYLGMYFDGNFIEAVAPYEKEGARPGPIYRYMLDTKAGQIPDGPHTFEVVLYGGEPTRILDRSKVNITVANKDIKVKKALLRYRFQEGVPLYYRAIIRSYLVTSDPEQEKRGSRPNEQIISDNTRKVEAVALRRLSQREIILRTRMLPPEFRQEGDTQVWIPDDSLGTIDQFFTDIGQVKVSQIPTFYPGWNPMNPGENIGYSENWIFPIPFPILPPEPVQAGYKWLAHLKVHTSTSGLGFGNTITDYFRPVQARGEVTGFEWAHGYQCARIDYTLNQKLPPGVVLNLGNGLALREPKINLSEAAMFAFDAGKLVRLQSTVEFEGIATEGSVIPLNSGQGGGGTVGGGPGGGPGGPTSGPRGGGPGRPPGAGPRGGPDLAMQQPGGGFGKGGGGPAASGFGGSQGNRGGFQPGLQGQPGSQGGPASETQRVRIRQVITIELVE